MRTYECMLLLDNREVRVGWEALKNTVAAMFTKHGAEVLSSRRWDERRLAYPIQRHKRATYLLLYCKLATEAVAALRRDLELSETVLRNLIRTCEEVPEHAYEPEVEFDETAIREEDPTPEPTPAKAEDKPEEESPKGGKSEDGESGDDKADGDKKPEGEGEPETAKVGQDSGDSTDESKSKGDES